MKKFVTVIQKISGQGTKSFKCNSLQEAQSLGLLFKSRLIDVMEFKNNAWVSLMF